MSVGLEYTNKFPDIPIVLPIHIQLGCEPCMGLGTVEGPAWSCKVRRRSSRDPGNLTKTHSSAFEHPHILQETGLSMYWLSPTQVIWCCELILMGPFLRAYEPGKAGSEAGSV